MGHVRRPERWLRVLKDARDFDAQRAGWLGQLEAAEALSADEAESLRGAQRREAVNVAGFRRFGGLRYIWWIVVLAYAAIDVTGTIASGTWFWIQTPLNEAEAVVAMGVCIVVYYGERALRVNVLHLDGRALSRWHQAWITGTAVLGTLQLATAHGDNTTIAYGVGLLGYAAARLLDPVIGTVVGAVYLRKLARSGRQSTIGFEVSHEFLECLSVLVNARGRLTHRRAALIAAFEKRAWRLERIDAWWSYPRRTGAGRRVRSATRRLGRHAAATLRQHADSLLTADTAAAYEEVFNALRRQALAAASGDLAPIMQDSDPVPVLDIKALISRAASPLVLVVTAVVLPHLPGVTVSGASLAGIQVGLLVGAVLSLLGVTGDDRRSVESAWNATASVKAKN